jgi:flagellar protein FliO/FliZ
MIENLMWWAISLGFVLVLILGFALLLKKFALPGATRSPIFRKNATRRLEVLESLPLDPKTRLMLIRRDDTNHLIIIGGTNDMVIEKNITPPPSAMMAKKRGEPRLAGDGPASHSVKDDQSSYDEAANDGDGGD